MPTHEKFWSAALNAITYTFVLLGTDASVGLFLCACGSSHVGLHKGRKPQCLATSASVPNIQEMNLFSPQVSLARAKNSLCNAATMQTLISVGPKQQTIEQETKALGIAHFVEGCHVASIRNISSAVFYARNDESKTKTTKKWRSHPHWETHERRPRPLSFIWKSYVGDDTPISLNGKNWDETPRKNQAAKTSVRQASVAAQM